MNSPASTATLTSERQTTHGDFADNSRISQRLKIIIEAEIDARERRGDDGLSFPHREALDMILHKISRIIAGNPDFNDHWDDIAGYAHIASKACAPPNPLDNLER